MLHLRYGCTSEMILSSWCLNWCTIQIPKGSRKPQSLEIYMTFILNAIYISIEIGVNNSKTSALSHHK